MVIACRVRRYLKDRWLADELLYGIFVRLTRARGHGGDVSLRNGSYGGLSALIELPA
jgi:hypothetical protein